MSSIPQTRVDTLKQMWILSLEWIDMNLAALTDEELTELKLPTGGTGLWILGHIVESEDRAWTFLGHKERLFPKYAHIFSPGSQYDSNGDFPTIAEAREAWEKVKTQSMQRLPELTDDIWDEPHALFEDPDTNMNPETLAFFATKGRSLMLTVLHQAYHNGQLGLIRAMAGKRI